MGDAPRAAMSDPTFHSFKICEKICQQWFGTSDLSKGCSKKGRSKKNVEYFNCHKKGHYAADCWAKGGGKEGQGP
jgi:hypothetical protein